MNFIKDFIFAGFLALSFTAAFASTSSAPAQAPAPVWQMSAANCVATTHLMFEDSSAPAEMRAGVYEDVAGHRIIGIGMYHGDFSFSAATTQQVLFTINEDHFVGELNVIGPNALVFVITYDQRLKTALSGSEQIVVRNLEMETVIDFTVRGISNALRRIEGCKYGQRL